MSFLVLIEAISISAILIATSGIAHADSRFRPHRPNFVLLRADSLGESEGGAHIEYNFSTRYNISTYGKDNLWESSLAYTGRFDFFQGSRDSSPIINRLNNPELLFRKWDYSRTGIFDYFQIAYGHESNGQQINSQELFDSDTRENRNDFISRGWDYISVEKKYSRYWKEDEPNCIASYYCTEFWLTYKGILSYGALQGSIEDAIFIPQRAIDDDIRNYDGLQAIASHEWEPKKTNFFDNLFDEFEVSLKLTTGSRSPLENITAELQLRGDTIPLPYFFKLRLPLYFVYRNGYVEEIADYSLRSNFVAFGLKFRD